MGAWLAVWPCHKSRKMNPIRKSFNIETLHSLATIQWTLSQSLSCLKKYTQLLMDTVKAVSLQVSPIFVLDPARLCSCPSRRVMWVDGVSTCVKCGSTKTQTNCFSLEDGSQDYRSNHYPICYALYNGDRFLMGTIKGCLHHFYGFVATISEFAFKSKPGTLCLCCWIALATTQRPSSDNCVPHQAVSESCQGNLDWNICCPSEACQQLW